MAMERWPAPEGYYKFADRNVVVVIIIEEARAVDSIEEIAATPGVDAMFIGVNDLSFSLGFGGQWEHPAVRDAVSKIAAAARKYKVPLGRPVSSARQVEQYSKEGYRFFQGPRDLGMMAEGSRALLEPLGKTGAAARGRSIY